MSLLSGFTSTLRLSSDTLILPRATVASILLVTLSVFWMFFQIGGRESTILFSDCMYVLCALLGAYWAGKTVFATRTNSAHFSPRHRLAWLMIGLGLFANSMSGLYSLYLEVRHDDLFPSYADSGFTLLYPLFFLGLLLMPTVRRFRVRMGLDALITTLCIFGVSWFFIIAPLYLVNVRQAITAVTLQQLLVGLSYPCWDIVLILAVSLLIQRRTEPLLRPSLCLFATGVLALIWADSGYVYANTFMQTYISGNLWIDPFWYTGYLLTGLAGLYQYVLLTRKMRQEQQHSLTTAALREHETELVNGSWKRIQSLITYIPFVSLLGITVWSTLFRDDLSDLSNKYLIVLTAIVGTLVAARYLYATHANETLLQERERERWQAEQLRQLSAELTPVLDVELLIERVTLAVTETLGFNAALLLLREEQSYNMGPQAHLLVNASTASAPVMTWRLQGQEHLFFYSLLLEGNAFEMQLDTLTCDVPPEIHAWSKTHQITTMYFFPFLYQGVTMGCLGLAKSRAHPLAARDVALGTAYAEQVTVIIKHAQLYREACEHEAFARAMANIATRLNAAIAMPSEIHQLICMEGASALQADYVIFYMLETSGQLVPLASFDPLAQVQPLYSEWPPIQPHENEAQVFYALQPTLVRPLMAQDNGNEQRAYSSSSLRGKLASHHIGVAIVAPLVAAGEPVGLLIFGRATPTTLSDKQSFAKEALPLAQDFAEQAAVALMNANLYQQLHRVHQQMQVLDALKDQFMATASHELRTPLTAVQGYLELLSQFDDILPPEQRYVFLQKARLSCEVLVLMLGNVMDASRLEIDPRSQHALLERVDLLDVVQNVLVLIEAQAQQELRTIQVAIPPEIIVLVDPMRLRQVLMNVSVNALKYSLPGTPLSFSARICATPTPSVILSVTDKGKGITPQDQGRLFQRFVRLEGDVNSSMRGSGLGLYISRRLLESIGGKIWIESSGVPGEGSTFHIQLAVA